MHKVLIIRNDKLGDFMLAWPAFSLIKQQYPDAEITALVPAYTQPMAKLCPWIDDVIIDDQHKSILADAVYLSRKFHEHGFDASISLYSEMRTTLALWLAHIPERYGPATKLAQIFLNHRLRQKRSSSSKPEYEYNADLARFYIADRGEPPQPLQGPPYLAFATDDIKQLEQHYRQQHNINPESKLVLLHAGSGGSAINMSPEQFAVLASQLTTLSLAHIVLTAGPGEEDTAKALSGLMPDVPHSIYYSTEGLESFSRFISIADLFISGSTGPLHIAGALNIPIAAFYPARRSATSLRWQTLSAQDRRLAFSPEKYSGDQDMQTINIDDAARKIIQFMNQLYS
jgi:ADP-heptose:LPS heptosyltransferase